MTGHVFEEHPLGAAFPDNPGDVGPEVPWIVGAAAFASCTEGLAGIPGEDDVEGAAKGTGIEAAKIIPDWCRGEVSCALCGDEHAARPVLPFDISTGVIVGFGEHDAQIQASAACAEGQSVKGT